MWRSSLTQTYLFRFRALNLWVLIKDVIPQPGSEVVNRTYSLLGQARRARVTRVLILKALGSWKLKAAGLIGHCPDTTEFEKLPTHSQSVAKRRSHLGIMILACRGTGSFREKAGLGRKKQIAFCGSSQRYDCRRPVQKAPANYRTYQLPRISRTANKGRGWLVRSDGEY